MKITVIIPTYRPQDYLWQCLDSFAAQTLDKRLWEVIVVLNGEAGEWLKQLNAYQQTHQQMNLHILYTPTAGVSHARNIGLDHAQGEYIGFVDDDDYVSPTYLAELMPLATSDTIAASYTIAFDDTQDHIPYYIESAYHRYAPLSPMPYHAARTYFSGPCMKLIHRDIIGDRRFDPRFASGEDSLFMFAISNKMHRIAFTGRQAVYYRRIRPASASHAPSWSRRTANSLRLIRAYTHIYIKGKGYACSFFLTRILGAIHTIISKP